MRQIGIDVRMASHTGIGRYLRGFLSHLRSDASKNQYVLIGGAETRRYFPAHFSFVPTRAPIYSLHEQISLLKMAKHCACLHSPHYNAPLLWRRKLVVTIHDLIHFHFPTHLPSPLALLYVRTLLPLSVRKADAIITVSEYTKKDIIKTLNVPHRKIFVIHHGVDPFFLSSHTPRSEPSIDHAYFLYVGLLKEHKNIGTLLTAFEQLKRKTHLSNLKLLIIGRPDTKQKAVRQWLRTIHSDPCISLKIDATDGELKIAYQNALALVFPSRYEGFGFPLLEAMASETPIIASYATSVPEVLGKEAGLYFDPNSSLELAKQMERILSSADLRHQLRQAGKKRLLQFDWKIASEKIEAVYESVLGSN